MKPIKWEHCHTEENACIRGDSIYLQCQKPGDWHLFHKSAQQKGKWCKADKDARAILLKKYTYVRKP